MTAHQDHIQLSSGILTKACPDISALQTKYANALIDKHPQKIFELISGIGSPLHCVFPQQFSDNIAAIQAVLEKHNQPAKIFFAKKANKAKAFAKACRDANIGMDVASKQEFELALAEGIKGENLSVSGPEKTIGLLQLAIYHGAQIAIDSLEELHKLTALFISHFSSLANAHHAIEKTKILLRFQPTCELYSRFGLASEQLQAALNSLKSYQQYVDLIGFSFHLSGYDIEERVSVTRELIYWITIARALGFLNCNQINIGGGLPVQYAEQSEWQQFLASLKPRHFHRNHQFPNSFYPYGNSMGVAESLDLLLSNKTGGAQSLAKDLSAHCIQLALEPGRALLDQAGVSVFGIQGIKKIHTQEPYSIATVTGMSFSLSEQWFGSEFLLSPTLLKPNLHVNPYKNFAAENTFPTAVAGNSCLECDMLSWRKIPFSMQPEVGDCLIYPNTAGYQMDSNESTFHSVPLTPKVAIWFHDQTIHWQLDSNF